MRIHVAKRPYKLTFHATKTSYLLTSEEVESLLKVAEFIVKFSPNRITLRNNVTIRPATLGGGPSFTEE